MTRQLNGRDVGSIGLGCMSFGGVYGRTDEDESFACLDAAIAAGVDHWDVAEIYGAGRCEEILGAYLSQNDADVCLATKAGIYTDPNRHFSNAPDRLRASLEGSLDRLKRSSVDLFYIHRREADRPIEQVMEILEGFRAEGMIHGIGLSEVAPSTLRRAISVAPVAAVQSEYSLWTRVPEMGMLQTCAELGVTFVAFSPLARGFLSDVDLAPDRFSANDFRKNQPRFQPENFQFNRNALEDFRAFCASRGWATSSVALAWVLDQGTHVLPIPGTRSAAHLHEFVAATDITLEDEDRAEIERLLPVGFAHGDRYSDSQLIGVERYC